MDIDRVSQELSGSSIAHPRRRRQPPRWLEPYCVDSDVEEGY